MKWYAGSDHAGLALKRHLVAALRELGDDVVDVGTTDEASVDYPEYGAEVGRRVAADVNARGLVVCGTGIGISIAARTHNDANIIALGARVIGAGVAEAALSTFRRVPFEGGRHQRRVDQLGALDKSKGS